MKFKIERYYISWAILIIIILAGVFIYVYRDSLGGNVIKEEASLIDIEDFEEGIGEEEGLEFSQAEEGEALSELISEPGKGNVYQETVEAGEGMTHLARKALKHYLEEEGKNVSAITPEHKIYIEDYLQNKTSDEWLESGQKIAFSQDLIEEAIESSLELSDAELTNLQLFTSGAAYIE